MEITLSILICSVNTEERQGKLKKLIYELQRQISKNYAEEIVEIIVDTDNMNKSVGQKRNDLIEKAQGEFICFIDDDDFVSENYLSIILYHLNPNIDILLIGIERIENGINKTKIIPSLYIDNLNIGEIVMKTNHFHLCPHKKSIARNVLFECVNFAEDMLYSQKMVKYINNSFLISQPIYIYFDNLEESLTRNETNRNSLICFSNEIEIKPIDINEKIDTIDENEKPNIDIYNSKEPIKKIELSEILFSIIPNLNDNFYSWFGDSKIVDTNNKPIAMYHKSRCQELFNEFRLENIEKNPYNVDYGVFFVNAHYSHSISYIADGLEYYVFLKIQNPFYIYDYNNQPYDMLGQTLIFIDVSKPYCEDLKARGYDGIIIKSNHYDQYIAFEPNQIKSVNNNGKYNQKTNNIFQ